MPPLKAILKSLLLVFSRAKTKNLMENLSRDIWEMLRPLISAPKTNPITSKHIRV